MHVLNFWTELQNAEVSIISLKSGFTAEALPAILKILGTNKVKIYRGVSFRYSWGGWIGQQEFFKRKANKDVFQHIHLRNYTLIVMHEI